MTVLQISAVYTDTQDLKEKTFSGPILRSQDLKEKTFRRQFLTNIKVV